MLTGIRQGRTGLSLQGLRAGGRAGEGGAEAAGDFLQRNAMAPDEVDRLLEPKVLAGAKRYTAEGVGPALDFLDSDNLIVRGNNLALASLRKRFEGQVKCIYIDPPYNTGDDGFGYNDRFGHSAWLTFMKNRLELAKALLRKDGSIFVQIDHHELGYVNVLMDEIFGIGNKVADHRGENGFPCGI